MPLSHARLQLTVGFLQPSQRGHITRLETPKGKYRICFTHCYIPRVSKIYPTGQIQPAACFCTVYELKGFYIFKWLGKNQKNNISWQLEMT